MEVVIRIVLMFFFVQFLVVTTAMAVALLLARPEVPALGRERGGGAIRRRLTFFTHLPSQAFRSVLRLMHRLPFLHSAQ